MIADAAFGRAARDVVLHAIAFKNFRLAAVHLDGNRHDELPLGSPEDGAHRLFEFEIISRAIELLFGDFKWI